MFGCFLEMSRIHVCIYKSIASFYVLFIGVLKLIILTKTKHKSLQDVYLINFSWALGFPEGDAFTVIKWNPKMFLSET